LRLRSGWTYLEINIRILPMQHYPHIRIEHRFEPNPVLYQEADVGTTHREWSRRGEDGNRKVADFLSQLHRTSVREGGGLGNDRQRR
jgi:hypothetical protein